MRKMGKYENVKYRNKLEPEGFAGDRKREPKIGKPGIVSAVSQQA